MKRRVIVVGIIALVCFVVYQFFFADRRSRLKVDRDKEPVFAVMEANEPLLLRQEKSPMMQVRNEGRKLIKEAYINFQVNDITAAKNSINTLITQFNAYVASHKEEEYGGPRYQTVVRIPSEKLDDFIARLEPLAKKIRSKDLSTKDVTDEYIDLTARLATKRDLEKNYREILRKATKVAEMLEVERELEQVRGDIESMEGRIEYINNHVSYSTLTITYYQQIVTEEEETFGQKVASSLGDGWSGVLRFVVAILVAWPLLIVGPLVLWFSVHLARKWRLIS